MICDVKHFIEDAQADGFAVQLTIENNHEYVRMYWMEFDINDYIKIGKDLERIQMGSEKIINFARPQGKTYEIMYHLLTSFLKDDCDYFVYVISEGSGMQKTINELKHFIHIFDCDDMFKFIYPNEFRFINEKRKIEVMESGQCSEKIMGRKFKKAVIVRRW